VGNKVLDKGEKIVGVMEELLSVNTIRNLEKCVQEQIMKVTRFTFKFSGYVYSCQ
jgi:hypothetical protein